MKYAISLLLVLVLITNQDLGDENNYSINNFLEYLQGNGYFEVIYSVKCETTPDIAVEFCEILCESPHCEEVVRVYMRCSANRLLSDKEEKAFLQSGPSRESHVNTSHHEQIEPFTVINPYPIYAQKIKLILERYESIIQKPISNFDTLIYRLENQPFDKNGTLNAFPT